MSLGRDDRWICDALGRALAGAQVYWCQPQPASTANNPPSPLATIYASADGGTPLAQPVLTDGFGHADAYLDGTQPFTVVVWHPLFGSTPLVLTDQFVSQTGAATSLAPFEGALAGTLDGTNKIFTLTNDGTPIPNVTPAQAIVWDNYPLTPGVGYVIVGNQITFATAPQVGDTLYGVGFYAST